MKILIHTIILVCLTYASHGQNNNQYTINDIYYIQYDNKTSSAFVIKEKSKNYLITTAHSLGFPQNGQLVSFQLTNLNSNFRTYSNKAVFVHSIDKVDVAVIPLDNSDYNILSTARNSSVVESMRGAGAVIGYMLGIIKNTQPEERIRLAKIGVIYADFGQNTFSPAHPFNCSIYATYDLSGSSGGPVIFNIPTDSGSYDLVVGVHAKSNTIRIPDPDDNRVIFRTLWTVAFGMEYVYEIISSIPDQ